MLDLNKRGFGPPVPLRSMATGSPTVPSDGGVYAAVLDDPQPAYLAESVGGHFKGRNPTVSSAQLDAKWIQGTPILYIGKATSLKRRIDQFARFGRGEPIGHWGGRYLWQLANSDDLLITWRVDADPANAEADLITEFVDIHGALPFANLNRPRTIGAFS